MATISGPLDLSDFEESKAWKEFFRQNKFDGCHGKIKIVYHRRISSNQGHPDMQYNRLYVEEGHYGESIN